MQALQLSDEDDLNSDNVFGTTHSDEYININNYDDDGDDRESQANPGPSTSTLPPFSSSSSSQLPTIQSTPQAAIQATPLSPIVEEQSPVLPSVPRYVPSKQLKPSRTALRSVVKKGTQASTVALGIHAPTQADPDENGKE